MTAPMCTISSEDLTVTVLPALGARLHSLHAFGVSLLRTPQDPYEHARDPFFWGAYHMAPWCNRLDVGSALVGQRTVDLRSNFSDGSAIHGQVFCTPWNATDDGVFTVSGGGSGWPWTYEVRLHVAVSGASVRLRYALTNSSDAAMPAGVGLHPWFLQPLKIRLPAARVFPVNAATQPIPQPVSDSLDLREGGSLPDDVDATWTDLTTAAVELAWPAVDISATMRFDADQLAIVAANPKNLDAVAVEPQTHAPAGLRRLLRGEPYGMRMLDPSDTLTLGIELVFTAATRGAFG